MNITEKKENFLFSIHNPVGVKLLARLRLQLSHLNGPKFRHGFEDTISPMCSYNTEIESNEHLLLRRTRTSAYQGVKNVIFRKILRTH